MVESSGRRPRFPTITNQLYQLAAGTVTSDELVRRSLDAIEASQSTLNAFRVVLTEPPQPQEIAATVTATMHANPRPIRLFRPFHDKPAI